jgi:hypothetical protein
MTTNPPCIIVITNGPTVEAAFTSLEDFVNAIEDWPHMAHYRVTQMRGCIALASSTVKDLFENSTNKQLVYSKRYFEWFCTDHDH